MTEARKRRIEQLRRGLQRDRPVTPIQPDAGPDPAERAQMVAGLRALAQFLEDRPEAPCPDIIEAQHTVRAPYDAEEGWLPLPDEAKIAAVREIANMLGIPPDIEDTRVMLEYPLGGNVSYVVYARLGESPTVGDARS